MRHRIFLFGEAEKGELCTPMPFLSLIELMDRLGHAPLESKGIPYAIQTLLFDRELIFYRVREEGFSREDYMRGVKLLYKEAPNLRLTAISLPGLGDGELIESFAPICQKHNLFMLFSESDLYDYLTGSKY